MSFSGLNHRIVELTKAFDPGTQVIPESEIALWRLTEATAWECTAKNQITWQQGHALAEVPDQPVEGVNVLGQQAFLHKLVIHPAAHPPFQIEVGGRAAGIDVVGRKAREGFAAYPLPSTNPLPPITPVSRSFRTPPHRDLPPWHPATTPLGQVLALGYQTLINGTSQQGDALPADLIAKVLASYADL